jgi:hypothetical protein
MLLSPKKPKQQNIIGVSSVNKMTAIEKWPLFLCIYLLNFILFNVTGDFIFKRILKVKLCLSEGKSVKIFAEATKNSVVTLLLH